MALAFGAAVVVAPAAHAGVQCTKPYQADPSSQYCTLYVGTPGGSGTGGSSGVSSNDCGNVPNDEPYTLTGYTFIPCYDPTFGWWDAADLCWVTVATPQPVAGYRAPAENQDPAWNSKLWDNIWNSQRGIAWTPDWAALIVPSPFKEGQGQVLDGHCYVGAANGGFANAPIWQRSITTPPPLAAMLDEAKKKLNLTSANITMAPTPNGTGLVGLPVWLSTADTDQTWNPKPVTVTAGGVTLTAVANGVNVTWDMGDGHTVVCPNHGTDYTPGSGNTPSPTCGYTYINSSGGQPDGQYKITAKTLWHIAWNTNTGANGVVTPAPTTTTTATVRIAELQVVGSSGG
ncbi:hypothetical protein KGQ19_00700 [Catenulispora sp. NL8]|uniref:ATP/GTP-binding protein n=1 Tax=Catenulispora pinistramenti TaxID=2705254 RepID=A0ABS5KGQ8_9ACTN|nr:hypothetical protein [Catenulispora pinistramenti]MBS2545378.1 hypothetical protein [Catenulispora pinistramenti]